MSLLNLAGLLLLFGNSKIQRSTFPISVPIIFGCRQYLGWKPWMNVYHYWYERTFSFLKLYRLIEAINADLPKGFVARRWCAGSFNRFAMKALREGNCKCNNAPFVSGTPPPQIIRYDNRWNHPGFLKSEEKLGYGSETRNPFIAVFHDTNLAETKGSGIRICVSWCRQPILAPPTFESSRENNGICFPTTTTSFLDANDLEWLKQFEKIWLGRQPKQALFL